MHGFHAYPARLHPVTANRLIVGLTHRGDRVMDPFCGSGTVLVEAQLEGRIAWGLDANPLAASLSSFKMRNTRHEERGRLLASAKLVAQAAEARRATHAGPSRRYPASHASQFDPHVLLELDGLQLGIRRIEDPFCREGLLLVLSAIANKVSRHTSDTTPQPSQRRWASGFVINFFCKKAEELTRRQADFSQRLPTKLKHEADVRLGDAQKLPFRNRAVTAIISSPPYPGIYDYVEHHRLRLQWLGLNASYLRKHEIGARRQAHSRNSHCFRNNYNAQLGRCLTEMVRVLCPGGTIALVVADTVIDAQAWYADAEIEAIADDAGLSLLAAASQERAHFHKSAGQAFGRRPRCERLLLLRTK